MYVSCTGYWIILYQFYQSNMSGIEPKPNRFGRPLTGRSTLFPYLALPFFLLLQSRQKVKLLYRRDSLVYFSLELHIATHSNIMVHIEKNLFSQKSFFFSLFESKLLFLHIYLGNSARNTATAHATSYG